MIHITSIRRPAGGLRKPAVDNRNKIPPKSNISLARDIACEILQAKLLDLDDEDQQDVIAEEILSSLQNKNLSVNGCLQMFLSTSWKDRHRKPLIAKVFHTVSQETDEDFATLIERQCNNLLNVLTLLGQPDINDLGLVTLLVNLYNVEDLPDEHRQGVEMYLVDIAKAFWPYFRPDKHERIWTDDICDAVCDVLNTVGKALDEKCPVNMERAFNNITLMLFCSSSISSYTLLRFLELKEFRASKWSLTISAKSYYKTAYLKHPRRSSSSSPERPDFPVEQHDVSKTPIMHKTTTYSSSSDSPMSCSDSDLSFNSPSQDRPLSSSSRSDSPSSADDDVFDLPNEPRHRNSYVINDSNYQVTIKTNTLDSGSKNAVVRVKQLCSINDIKTLTVDNVEDSRSCSVIYPEGKTSLTDQSVITSSTAFNERVHPARALIDNGIFDTFSNFQSTSHKQSYLSHSGTSEANPDNNSKPSGGFGLPGQYKLHRFSIPEHSDLNRGGFSRGFQSFRRAQPENADMESSHDDQEASVMNRSGFPKKNDFKRSLSESNSSYSDRQFNHTGGFPRYFPYLQRTLSESDSSHIGDNESQLQRPYQRRSSDDKYHRKCMLEFPVEEVDEETCDRSSRLYLLSFAVKPSSLEKPLDLTISPELPDDKSWLKDIVLRKPVTVLDRFGTKDEAKDKQNHDLSQVLF